MTVAALWPNQLAAGIAIAAGLAAVMVFVGAAVAYAAVDRAGRQRSRASADAIVVLGAEAAADRPSPELRARLDGAVEAWDAGQAPVVVCCGGVSDGVDERDVMAAYLGSVGVTDTAIVTLDGATTRRSMQSVAAAGFTRILVVTSPYHVRRAVTEARRHGLVAVGCPAANSPEQLDPTIRRLRTVTEVVALAWYALPGSVTAHAATGPRTIRHRVPELVAVRVRRRRTGDSAAQADDPGHQDHQHQQ